MELGREWLSDDDNNDNIDPRPTARGRSETPTNEWHFIHLTLRRSLLISR